MDKKDITEMLEKCPFCGEVPSRSIWPGGAETGDVVCLSNSCPFELSEFSLIQWRKITQKLSLKPVAYMVNNKLFFDLDDAEKSSFYHSEFKDVIPLFTNAREGDDA